MDTQSTSSTSLHFSSTSNFSSSSNIREKLTILEKTIGIGDPPPPGGGYFGVDSTSLGTFESSQLQVGKSLLRSCQSGGGVTNSSVQQQLLFKRRFYSQDLERIQPDGCQIGECEETGELRRQQQKLYSSLVNKVGHMLCEGGLVSSIKQSEGGFRGGGENRSHSVSGDTRIFAGKKLPTQATSGLFKFSNRRHFVPQFWKRSLFRYRHIMWVNDLLTNFNTAFLR